MPSQPIDFYTEAHLLVAAIRIFEHGHSRPPVLEEICELLSFSTEQAGFISRRLTELGIVEAVQGSFGTRFFIKDHLKLEEIPRGEIGRKLEDEIRKFQDSQKGFARRMESLKAEHDDKKKSLFAEMERKLKEELDKKGKAPG
jgi:DNA-binding IscR family transcriptional regulator